jgi:micrococcal nuclease
MKNLKLPTFLLALLVFAAANLAAEETAGKGLYRVHDLASYKNADFSKMLSATVTRVVDGDTIVVTIAKPPEGLYRRERIRLIGVDTPETVHPSKPVERFGKEASDFTKAALTKKIVRLAFDKVLRDRYGRLLAYVYVEKGRCFNAELVEKGYGHAYTAFPFQFLEEFRKLQAAAREKKAGLWGSP